MAPGCERSRPVVAGPGGAYAVALRSMHGGLCPVSCAPSPVSRAPCPCPRPRFTCSAFRVLRPAPHARVFRVPHPRPAPAAPHPAPVPVPPSPAPRTPRPCPWLRLLRPADGCPCSAPCLPPRTSGQVLPASASRRDEKKIGRFPTGTSRFCMHCSGASYSRLRIISPPW